MTLAASLQALYEAPRNPGERWGHRPALMVLPDGRSVPRESAWRDHPLFVEAAARLLRSPLGDDAPLGAWLLGTLPPTRGTEAEPVLAGALHLADSRARFEAAIALGQAGSPASLPPLDELARAAGDGALRGSAAWSAARIRERRGDAAFAPPERRLPEGFQRGVCWWHEGHERDHGAASFRLLASFGVTWVSIHTWDPLQRAVDAPDFAAGRRRFAPDDLPAWVRAAHAAGLKVMLKPHLEMRGYEPTPAERGTFDAGDRAAIQALLERIRPKIDLAHGVSHVQIEMKSDAAWRQWFTNYEAYVVDYARQAGAAGADAFCVGREIDRTVVRREADWRRLIARVRAVYPGPLTYSAHFETYASLGFWDALDFVGVAAYFPLSRATEPTLSELERAWDAALAPMEVFSARLGKAVVLTELGVPAVRGGAAAPWEERRGPADVWAQAAYYEAALRAVARRPFIAGTFFWLWEGTTQPPFRDASFSIQGKPAAFAMADAYR